jgi:hypothetical protein
VIYEVVEGEKIVVVAAVLHAARHDRSDESKAIPQISRMGDYDER